jgi:hypothetical protein
VKNGRQLIEKQSRLYWDLTSFWQISIWCAQISIWCAQIPATKFFTVTPIIVGPHYGPCFMSPFWHLEFWDLFPEFLGKFVHPWYMGNTQRWDSAKYHNLAELQRNLITVCSGPSLIKFPYSLFLPGLILHSSDATHKIMFLPTSGSWYDVAVVERRWWSGRLNRRLSP